MGEKRLVIAFSKAYYLSLNYTYQTYYHQAMKNKKHNSGLSNTAIFNMWKIETVTFVTVTEIVYRMCTCLVSVIVCVCG